MSEVSLEHVTKRFDSTVAVNDVSIDIDDGEVMGIVGPSGCGKTTALRLVAGFETPTDGTIRYDGEDVTHVPPENRNVGLVFQSYALFNNMSVLKNVTFGPKMHGVGKDERRERAYELLELLDIEELADRNPKTLSGGQQQRVGLARALAIEPHILLLDEPMTGLDAKLKQTLREELGQLLDDLGVTTLYVTHDQEQAMSMCDRIAVMNEGHLEQIGTPAEIYEEPANEFVAGFIGTANLLEGTVRDGTLSLGFEDVETPETVTSDGEVTVLVRPDDIPVGSGPVEVEVTNLFYQGEHIQATGELPDGRELTLRLDRSETAVGVGDTVSVDFDPDALHIIESTK
ncbi:ABC transporter ATP-binding protein [Halobellus limi]|jgi:putative spermidine/putrescine transport system ATP-binding protein|uniref:Molybdate/tungstate import ATP-binding protein WtpC n=1 Tax=Halobellus limi TaxID=699433 RepID=A0A1H5SMC9_9EURY|nr:ABC transporter ATP-binding protein [Halobellus limi]QCC47550.1 ABC transporter ATP-binding protein [Halobellus limi]SEF51594.1 putative spermidine/putrescine transport system ATP-binding protein [Halobellus limi]